MLTVNSTYGSFHIPDGAEFCIYLCNQETMRYTAADTGKEDIYEYGDVVFETSHMKYIFREMRDPFDFYLGYLETLELSGNLRLYVDAFDPAHIYRTLEIQAKGGPLLPGPASGDQPAASL